MYNFLVGVQIFALGSFGIFTISALVRQSNRGKNGLPLSPQTRDIGIVFLEASLIAWLTKSRFLLPIGKLETVGTLFISFLAMSIPIGIAFGNVRLSRQVDNQHR
jgi:hypothetical protein